MDESLLSSGRDLRMQPQLAIGHVYCFENIVVYGNPLELGKRIKSQLGEFLGIVKGVIPVDPYFVLYERLKHKPSYLKRQKLRKFLRKRHITRLTLKRNRKLTEWI